jgi:hypothetical protein
VRLVMIYTTGCFIINGEDCRASLAMTRRAGFCGGAPVSMFRSRPLLTDLRNVKHGLLWILDGGKDILCNLVKELSPKRGRPCHSRSHVYVSSRMVRRPHSMKQARQAFVAHVRVQVRKRRSHFWWSVRPLRPSLH